MHNVYTDGSCKNGFGGWGVVVVDGPVLYGHANKTTSCRMEMQAIIEALVATIGEDVCIHTDSSIIALGLNYKIKMWKQQGWQRSRGKLKDKDLWMVIDKLMHGRVVACKWVESHSGDENNDTADHLAKTARQQRLEYE